MEKKAIWIAVVAFFALTASAFAQATFTVGSIPVTTVANTGQTEKTGDITFTTVTGSPNTVTGTFTISYGVPITVPTTAIQVVSSGCPAPAPSVLSVDNAAGILVIRVPAGCTDPTNIRVTGVRVATAGTALTELSAAISSTGNALVAGQTSVRVIYSIAAGIASVTSTPASVHAVTGAVTGTPVNFKVKEGFLGAYGVTEVTDPTQTHSTMVRITLNSAPPSGVTLTFPGVVSTDKVPNAFKTAAADGTVNGADVTITSASTVLSVYYRVVVDTDLTAIETLTVPITVATAATPRPIAATTITATATLAPIGTAFGTGGAVLTTPIPRYAAAEVGPGTIFTVVPGTTALMTPYVTVGQGYDTGIAIANTTSDPGLAALGFKGAVSQSGKIKFYFYPTVGSSFSYTTSSALPGVGLDSTGSLASGRTYTVLLSALLEAAGGPSEFSGYLIIVTEFTNAHGECYISDFSGFTSRTSMHVIAGDRTVTPEQFNQ